MCTLLITDLFKNSLWLICILKVHLEDEINLKFYIDFLYGFLYEFYNGLVLSFPDI